MNASYLLDVDGSDIVAVTSGNVSGVDKHEVGFISSVRKMYVRHAPEMAAARFDASCAAEPLSTN
jgi:hypothetical protein